MDSEGVILSCLAPGVVIIPPLHRSKSVPALTCFEIHRLKLLKCKELLIFLKQEN